MIVKHNNPCGAAVGSSALDAYEKAFACDPLSAFGGVLVFNRRIDVALAERLSQQFVEVLLAPGFEQDALEILTRKEAIRILDVEDIAYEPRERDIKRVRGGRTRTGRGPDRGDARDDGRTNEGAAARGAVGRPALRLEGLPPRSLECDRLRQGRGNGGNRRRPDEPG